MQQRVNGVVLGNIDLQLLHGLATGENVEHVSSEHVVRFKFHCLRNCWWVVNCSFPIEDEHILCITTNVRISLMKYVFRNQYVPSMH